MTTIAERELLELRRKLAERETLLRSVACVFAALGAGVFRDTAREDICTGVAARIRDLLEPRRGMAAGR